MKLKIVTGVVAVALVLAYIAPVALKLKDMALSAVVLIGVTMMVVDVWQSLRSKKD